MRRLKDFFKDLEPHKAQNIMELVVPLGEMIRYESGTTLEDNQLRNGRIMFLEKGLARLFHYNEKGEEITAWLIAEANFISYLDLPNRSTFSHYSLGFLEDSVVYSMSWEKMLELAESNPTVGKHLLGVSLQYVLFWQQRAFLLQFHTAEERYDWLMETQPDLFLRAPLQYIASYLNMRPATLSRLRSGSMKKS